MIKKISLYIIVIFYVAAGINHFVNPLFYLPLIPDYLPNHELINWVSGFLEAGFGLAMIPDSTRKAASIGIIVLLIAFIPSHIYFIQTGSCVDNSLCVSPVVAWIRLLVVHPLLIYWAYFAGTVKTLKS